MTTKRVRNFHTKDLPRIRRSRGALGELLMVERERLGLSMSDLGRIAGVSTGRVQEYEIGKYCPGRRTMTRLLHALNLPQGLAPFLQSLSHIDSKLESLQVELCASARKLIAGRLSVLGTPIEQARPDTLT